VLRDTSEFGEVFEKTDSNCCLGYSDTDWAGDRNDRKSTSGYCFLLSNGVVSWHKNKQNCFALSAAETEYLALAGAAQEAVWLKQLLSDLNHDSDNALTIFEDN
jgi:hypothetical protein